MLISREGTYLFDEYEKGEKICYTRRPSFFHNRRTGKEQLPLVSTESVLSSRFSVCLKLESFKF